MPYGYKTQRMCNEADCLEALKFIPDWFVTSEMFEKFHDTLPANDNTLFFNEDFNKVLISANQIDILAVDIDEINIYEDNDFDEDDPETIIHVIFWT